MKSRWNVTEMSQWYVSTTSYWYIFPKVTTMSHQWVFHNISKKSQMKHPTMSQWFATKTFQWYVSTTFHQYVPVTSPVNPKRSTQRCRCGLSSPYLQVTLLRRLIGRFILRFQIESIYFVITSVWQVSMSLLGIKLNNKFFYYQPGWKREEQFRLYGTRNFITFENSQMHQQYL